MAEGCSAVAKLVTSEEALANEPLLAEGERGCAQQEGSEAAWDAHIVEVAPLEINHVAGSAPSNNVSQTLYVPVLFPNCKEPQWALIDTGA
jgi:hypothetical protein